MKRLKQLITENYREPDADGKFDDCAEEVLKELIQQDQSDDEDDFAGLNFANFVKSRKLVSRK